MSHTRSKSKRLFASEVIAGTSTATFDISDVKYVSIQVKATESCLCASSTLDECISLSANTFTIASHGFVTGLKGTVAAVTGCAVVTPSACISTCCNLITEACHGLTTGERGRFTTSCTLPSFCCCVISACTDYYVISLTACTYTVATTRALALAGTSVCITGAGVGCQTFTPNGTVPVTACCCLGACNFIIKIDCCTVKFATSKANAIAGTAIDFTAKGSPAATSFTPAAGDATSGTVTVKYTNNPGPCAVYVADSGIGLLASGGVINACSCGLCVIDAETGVVPYRSVQVTVCVTDSQWILDVDANGKD